MSFIKPLVTTILNVSSSWYYSVRYDERYTDLMKALDIAKPTTLRHMYYRCFSNENNGHILKDCISKGDDAPAQLEDLRCTNNMKQYRQSVPAFRYNDAVFPPYGDTKHHWYITTVAPYRHVSLITNSKKAICNYISYTFDFQLHFVPLPGTLQ